MKFNLTDVTRLIRTRRSIRPEQLRNRKVHRDQLELMFEAANWAPNHGKTEPWRFKVFQGEALLSLQQQMSDVYKEVSAPDAFLQSKYEQIQARAQKASVAIVVWMKRQESGRIPEEEEMMAVACAVQNMSLVATAYGMGLFWSSGKVAYAPSFAKYLGIESPDRVLGVLYPGYPEEEWPEGKRNIWMNKVEWNGF